MAIERPLSSEQLLASFRQVLGDGRSLPINAEEKSWQDWQMRFDKAFANPPREPEVDHNPTVKAALFLMNDAVVLGWLKPEGDNLPARLLKQDDAAGLTEELYFAVLTREPTAEERQDVAEYLASRPGEREAAIRNLVWSLLASNEFCMNH